MINLLETNRETTCPAGSERDVATIDPLSDSLLADAQAVYQIALARLRLHRNRWKAPGSTQAEPSQA